MEKWSVIACDQHSSEPEYWDALDLMVGTAPSTLRMMLPEAYLDRDISVEVSRINSVMRKYLEEGIFTELHDSYVYVERTLPSGVVRRGLVGAVDLNEYDYSKGSVSAIRATEGTVEERLPARVQIRRGAALEMPHIMIFIDDPGNHVFSSIRTRDPLYDFDLNCGGGHLAGYRVSGQDADRIDSAVEVLVEEARQKYRGYAPAVFAIGDGNHSLATAKKCGDRYALVELVDINDPSITFEPIHRVLFDTDTSDFIRKFGSSVATVQPSDNYADLILKTDAFCREYLSAHGGRVDYIHNDDAAIEMGRRDNCASLLLPSLDKTKLFESIIKHGPFPKKSFSIGHACDKRYYLECRKLGE